MIVVVGLLLSLPLSQLLLLQLQTVRGCCCVRDAPVPVSAPIVVVVVVVVVERGDEAAPVTDREGGGELHWPSLSSI